jgi:DNA-binding transcriptional ArsR family regulator
MCKALGNPVRLQIVRFIQRHPRSIGNQILLQLPDNCVRAQSTLSQHLKVLRDAELLSAEEDGPATSYTVNDQQLNWLRSRLDELLDPPGSFD